MENNVNRVLLDDQLLEEAVFSIADGYCRFDLTKDQLWGSLHNVIGDTVYDLNEQLGLPENASFTEAAARWALTVPESDRPLFLREMDRDRLLERFRNGEHHTSFTYWTCSAANTPLLAENHLIMFEDRDTGDVIGINYMVDRTEQFRLRQSQEELEESKRDLEQKNQKLQRLLEAEKSYNVKLYRDVQTGAYNRRYYEEIVNEFVGPAGVALMDLDDFKIYNDTYGHHAGDLALQVAAGAIRSCIRSTDILIRLGGDEFLLMLVDIPAEALQKKLEQIRDKLCSSSVPGYPHLHLSVSIGGAMQTVLDPLETIVRRVDRLMYRAKDRKNEVVVDIRTEEPPEPDTEPGDARPQVLIVDDSMMNRALLAEILSEDYRILEAENGQACLDALSAHRGDVSLVLLDINMPVMDGFEVLKRMGVDHTLEDIPVIMISGDASVAAIRKAYELGAADYISRPFDARIVYRRVLNTTRLYLKQRRLVRMVSSQIQKQEHNTSMLVSVLSQIVEFRNGESGAHVRHIRVITELLLNHLLSITNKYDIDPDEQEDIPLASVLHDIGKIAIDERILNKPGRLTREEFEIIKTHSMHGAEMLSHLEDFENESLLHTAYEITRWHHERWDGRGYPDGLKGDEIPISAQIVSMADVYDALTSERCYKPPFTHEDAIRMIRDGECGVFNPLLLRCLLEVQDELKAELQSGYAEPSANRMLHGRQTEKAAWRDTMLVQAMLPEFEYICRIDMATKNYTVFFTASSETELPRYSSNDYDESLIPEIAARILPEQREDIARKMHLDNVAAELASARDYTLYTTVTDAAGCPAYKKLRFCYIDEGHRSLLLICTDVSGETRERKKREKQEQFLIRELQQSRAEIKRVLETTMIAVFQYDPQTDEIQRNIFTVDSDNQKFHTDELFRLFIQFDRIDEDTFVTLKDCFRRMQRGEHSLSAPIRCKRRNATEWIWCKLVLFDYQDEMTKARRVLGYIQDVNSDMTRQTRLLELAQTDALTGLLNVGAGRSRIRRLLKAPEKGCRAMIMMDIDNFKAVNDTHGHLVGDNTLKALAAALSKTFAGSAVVYRLGGDEFAVFLPHLEHPDEEAPFLMQELQGQLVQLQAAYPFLSVSAGVYITDKVQSYETCYDEADKALYQTKKREKGSYTISKDCE